MIDSNSKIQEIHKALSRFNLQREARKSAIDNKDLLVDLNRDQIRLGQDGDGDARDYSPYSVVEETGQSYREYKRDLATYFAPFPRIDLYNTGSFQNKMFMKTTAATFQFWSRDTKTDEIVKWEGAQIFDLNPYRMSIAQSIVEEDLRNKIKAIFE